MADTWKTLYDRTVADSGMVGDNNDRNACVNAIKGGDRGDAPVDTIENIDIRLSAAEDQLENMTQNLVTDDTGTAYTIDLDSGRYFVLTLTDNCTFTFPASVEADLISEFWIYLKRDATAGRTITWPSTVKWPMDILPALDTTASTLTVFHFYSLGLNTRWYGEVLSMGHVT